jgi:hypothetical protein
MIRLLPLALVLVATTLPAPTLVQDAGRASEEAASDSAEHGAHNPLPF